MRRLITGVSFRGEHAACAANGFGSNHERRQIRADAVPILTKLSSPLAVLKAEGQALDLYRQLLPLVEGRLVGLEEVAKQTIQAEEVHAAEVDKMLRKPGEVASFAPCAD
jgi:hypothetical protein